MLGTRRWPEPPVCLNYRVPACFLSSSVLTLQAEDKGGNQFQERWRDRNNGVEFNVREYDTGRERGPEPKCTDVSNENPRRISVEIVQTDGTSEGRSED